VFDSAKAIPPTIYLGSRGQKLFPNLSPVDGRKEVQDAFPHAAAIW
jgi:hypothetical protein